VKRKAPAAGFLLPGPVVFDPAWRFLTGVAGVGR